MKRIISALFILAQATVAYGIQANVQTTNIGGPLTSGFSTGANTITVSSGGGISLAAGSATTFASSLFSVSGNDLKQHSNAIFVIGGSSLSAPNNGTTSNPSGTDLSWPAQAITMSQFAGRGTMTRTAVPGRNLADVLAGYDTEVHPHAPAAGVKGYYIVDLVANDFTNGSLNIPTWKSNFQTLVAKAVADNLQMIVLTGTERSNGVSLDAQRQTLNAYILANRNLGYWVAEVDKLTPDQGDTTIFPDYTHPSPLGCYYWAKEINTVIETEGHSNGQYVARTRTNLTPGLLPVVDFGGNLDTYTFYALEAATGGNKDVMLNISTPFPYGGSTPSGKVGLRLEVPGSGTRAEYYLAAVNVSNFNSELDKSFTLFDEATNLPSFSFGSVSGIGRFYAPIVIQVGGVGTTAERVNSLSAFPSTPTSAGRQGQIAFNSTQFAIYTGDGSTHTWAYLNQLDSLGSYYASGDIVSTRSNTVPASYGIASISVNPRFFIKNSGAASDQKAYDLIAGGSGLYLRAMNDSDNAATDVMEVSRSGMTITSVVFPSIPVTASSFTGSLIGNATTATALATARAINGVNFDGTAPITVAAAAGTLTGATLASGVTASSLISFGSSPALGTATATSINGNTITTGTGTLTLGSSSLTNTGTSTLSTFVGSGTSSGTNTGDQTSVSGNAGTATALQTARTINGVSFDGTANITISISGHLIGTGSAPTIAAGAGDGTGGTVAISGTDTAGEVTFTTGTLPTVNAVIATITFASSYGASPRVILWPSEANASGLGFLPYVTGSTTTFTVSNAVSVGLLGSTTYKYNYHVIQ